MGRPAEGFGGPNSEEHNTNKGVLISRREAEYIRAPDIADRLDKRLCKGLSERPLAADFFLDKSV